MDKLKGWDWFTLVILIIGGINWLLVGLFNFNGVAAIFGSMSMLVRLVYVLVGLTAIYIAAISRRLTRRPSGQVQRAASPGTPAR
jgi:uncharacterized membrane protein YuzA (DUF378 family)